ncbi:MAG: DUF2779 domain-containing protein, partial [Gemmatimonadota bacterium]|nr:DUF2779 domain-containing protein [Gemmatimonadota bacterium]
DVLEEKLVDLLPVVRNHVYHPDFLGSFSIKYVLNPLVPDLTYEGLDVKNGLVASARISKLLLNGHELDEPKRKKERQGLLEYCKLDTLAMVKLLEKLKELADKPAS